jgi:hypothetical protein
VIAVGWVSSVFGHLGGGRTELTLSMPPLTITAQRRSDDQHTSMARRSMLKWDLPFILRVDRRVEQHKTPSAPAH